MAGNPHERLVPVFNCGYGDTVSLTTAVATLAELFPCCVPIKIVIDDLYVRACGENLVTLKIEIETMEMQGCY